MNPCETCAFSDCGIYYYVCLDYDNIQMTMYEGEK